MLRYITIFTFLFLVLENASALNITHEPYTESSILSSQFKPIISYFDAEGYKNTHYVETRNFNDFYKAANNKSLDIIFATILHARILIDELGYIPILVKDTSLKAVVITKKDSNIKSMAQLEGKTIFSPFPYDPAAYLGKSCLGETHANIIDVNGISSVIVGVLNDKSDAGFIADIDILFMVKSMQDELNVLATSKGSANTYILVSPNYQKDMQKIKDTFLRLNNNPLMKEISKNHGFNRFLTIDNKLLLELKNNSDAVEKIYESLQIREMIDEK